MGWGGVGGGGGGSSPPFLSLFVSNSAKYGKGGGGWEDIERSEN